ncbi:MAG: tetratricopeptide repeat protein [Streptosporangiaceae bacterium]
MLTARGRQPEAQRLIREALRLEDSNAAYHAYLGQSFLAEGRPEESERQLREALQLEPDCATYHAGLGHALATQKKLAAALQSFEKAVRLDPGEATYAADVGRALLAQDRPAPAEEALREAIRLDPSVPAYRADLGQAYLRQGQLEQAEIILDDLLRLSLSATDSSADELEAGIASAYDEKVVRYAQDLAERTSDKPYLQRRGISWLDYLDGIPRIARQQLPGLRGCYRSWSDARRGEQLARAGKRPARLGLRFRGRAALSPASLILEDQLVSLMTNLVLEPAEAAALEVSWKDSADDRVSVQDGPELSAKAELANLITTDANTRLAKAVNRRYGAAVALAGPRGCGKTELARRFTELQPHDPRSRVVPLVLSAPTSYDECNFLLRILKELCHSILATGTGTEGAHGQVFSAEHRRRARLRALIAGGLIGLGLAIPLTWAAGVALATLAAFATGSVLVLAGLGALIGQRGSRPGQASRPRSARRPSSAPVNCSPAPSSRKRGPGTRSSALPGTVSAPPPRKAPSWPGSRSTRSTSSANCAA